MVGAQHHFTHRLRSQNIMLHANSLRQDERERPKALRSKPLGLVIIVMAAQETLLRSPRKSLSGRLCVILAFKSIDESS